MSRIVFHFLQQLDVFHVYKVIYFLAIFSLQWISKVCGIIASENKESASPCKMPLWIFTPAKIFLPLSIPHSSLAGFSDEFKDLFRYFQHS